MATPFNLLLSVIKTKSEILTQQTTPPTSPYFKKINLDD